MDKLTALARKLDPRKIAAFAKTLNGRDAGHFAAAFVSSLAILIMQTDHPLTKDVVLAAIPGAAAVAFRQVWPNTDLS